MNQKYEPSEPKGTSHASEEPQPGVNASSKQLGQESADEALRPTGIHGPAGEIVLHGIPASPGIVMGKVIVLKKDGVIIQERSIDDSSAELERLYKSIDRSSTELDKVYNATLEETWKRQGKDL